MPAERITMRDAREIIRLKFSSVSTHEIARRQGKFGQRPRGNLVRDNGLRNGPCACAGFDDAPHRFIGKAVP